MELCSAAMRRGSRFALDRFVIIVCLLVALGPSGSVSVVDAREWRVQSDGSGDAPTIQAAIDSAAVNRDSVLVGPGTYLESIDTRGKALLLRSVMGPESTTLQGNTVDPVICIQSGETQATVVEGFTITNGGGGIEIRDSAPTIRGNVITNNIAAGVLGGGICCFSVSAVEGEYEPIIVDNRITNNWAPSGGGVFITNRMRPLIKGNVFAENVADPGDGGGLFFAGILDGTVIDGNQFIENVAEDHGGALGVTQGGDTSIMLEIEITGNVFVNNEARGDAGFGTSGGGLILRRTNAVVRNNTFAGNSGGPDDDYGGAIVMDKLGSPVVERNIIANTTAGSGVACHDAVTPIFRDNIVWMNQPSHGNGPACSEEWWTQDGNVVADPLFCDLEGGDIRVAKESPALSHPAGVIGAEPNPACQGTPVVSTTWGRLKIRHGQD